MLAHVGMLDKAMEYKYTYPPDTIWCLRLFSWLACAWRAELVDAGSRFSDGDTETYTYILPVSSHCNEYTSCILITNKQVH